MDHWRNSEIQLILYHSDGKSFQKDCNEHQQEKDNLQILQAHKSKG